jgi:hypothetical protein
MLQSRAVQTVDVWKRSELTRYFVNRFARASGGGRSLRLI